jgi:hypothetical protein
MAHHGVVGREATSEGREMKLIFGLLLIPLLVGCGGRIINADGSPAGLPVDTGSEVLHVVVPDGSKIGFQANRPGMQIVEYVPLDQSVKQWTDMLTVVIADRQAAPDIDAFFKRMTDTFHVGCDVEPIVEKPTRFLDGPYPAGLQAAICGKGRQNGYGQVVIYKMIQGTKGFFQVQRAWRFPPAAKSEDLPLTEAMRKSATERLAAVYLCDREVPDNRC